MAEKEIILKNFKEYKEIAQYSFDRGKYNAAVTLYYKALVELCDILLLEKLNKIGANHTDRFELLKSASPQVYSIASKLFRFYRDSYSKQISKTVVELIKKEVENAEKLILKN